MNVKRFDHVYAVLLARHKPLPIGLPNNSNLCYLNALLQAMASSRSLVNSLKRSAAVRRNRLLCCLVALLEGLRCSSGYLKKHNLVEILADAHRTFVEELTLTEKWSVNEQQSVARCCHRNSPLLFDVGSKNPMGLAEAFRQSPFHTIRINNPQHHLISNQIICTKCRYHGALKLVPEACITLFPYDFTKQNNKKKRSARRIGTVSDLLIAQFHEAEKLSGINCPRCHMKSLMPPAGMLQDTTPLVDKRVMVHLAESECRNTCVVRRWVAHLPPCLVLYVQRAIWKRAAQLPPDSREYLLAQSDGIMVKYTDHITFPENIDMALLRFGRTHAPDESESDKSDVRPAQPNGTTCHSTPQVQEASPETEQSHKTFAGNGMKTVVHQGPILQAGHYVTYRRWRGRDTDWLLTSDRHILPVSLQNVLSAQAYMLFYEAEPARSDAACRRDTTTPVSTEKEDDSEDEEDGAHDDNDDSEEALDVFDGLSRAELIRTLATSAVAEVV
ncbi:unnamed protein product [Schistocephalus solidus]|uniref:ubiquitinyl hydrolase 1 n=1 Tax=Schistocephalus solidus TaxID=70667 RepID=A0A183SG22_SCHSO|nr:unnamed protein product [Schistocephalus solidus]